MTKNPFINALVAALYIVSVVLLISQFERLGVEESLLIPMVMLSLLVLSVLAMAYIFFFEPLQLYLDGNKKEAAVLFMQTAGIFAGITVLLLLTLLALG